MLRSFKCAAAGVVAAVRTERNLKIMFVIMLFVVAAGFWLRISAFEWIAVLLCCGIVITLELVNTAIESSVDLSCPSTHTLAKRAKDIAAGAVLIFSLTSIAIGCIVFIPHILQLIGG